MWALRTLLFLALFGVSSSQMSDCSYSALLNYLNLTTSNQVLEIMRPVKNWEDSTVVKVDMVLLGILDVDEKLQTVTNHIWIQMNWTNEFLTWNSSEFCGIDVLTLPRSMVWIPDITIQEDVSDTASIQEDPFLTLDARGSLFAQVRQRLSYTCQLDLSMFPFDVQRCSITFSSMSSGGRMITLTTNYNDTILSSISVTYLKTQGEWNLKKLKVIQFNQSDDYRSKLSYMITLERKPFLYLINLIVPLCFLLFLDLTSFFIDEARGEKLGFKVTILLSISVLLLILQDMLPSTEENLPMIARYFLGVFTMMWMSILETMLVSFMIDLDGFYGNEAQSSADTDVTLEERAGDEDEAQVTAEDAPPADRPGEQVLLKQILEKVTAFRQEAARRRKDQRSPGCYRRAAKIIDIVFFILYFLAVVVFVLSIISLWSKALI